MITDKIRKEVIKEIYSVYSSAFESSKDTYEKWGILKCTDGLRIYCKEKKIEFPYKK